MSTNNLLEQLDLTTPEGGNGIIVTQNISLDGVEPGTNVAKAADDETGPRVLHVTEGNDTVLYYTWAVPMDFDETSDYCRFRVLVSQLLVSSDPDVEIDMLVYLKTPGSAVGSDLDPTAPGTILSATEVWEEFNLDGNDFSVGDVVTFKVITNGANDTNAEEVLIHGLELRYKSQIVANVKSNR